MREAFRLALSGWLLAMTAAGGLTGCSRKTPPATRSGGSQTATTSPAPVTPPPTNPTPPPAQPYGIVGIYNGSNLQITASPDWAASRLVDRNVTQYFFDVPVGTHAVTIRPTSSLYSTYCSGGCPLRASIQVNQGAVATIRVGTLLSCGNWVISLQ